MHTHDIVIIRDYSIEELMKTVQTLFENTSLTALLQVITNLTVITNDSSRPYSVSQGRTLVELLLFRWGSSLEYNVWWTADFLFPSFCSNQVKLIGFMFNLLPYKPVRSTCDIRKF